jgi:hypothetical protein
MIRAHGEDAPKPPRVTLRRVDEAPLRGPPKRVGDTMWSRRRAGEAPLSNAGAFFSKNVRWWRSRKFQKNLTRRLIFCTST